MGVLVGQKETREEAEGKEVSSVHKYGFEDPRKFVQGLLDCGWDADHNFVEALCERHPDFDSDDVEDWIEEWKSGTE